MLGGNGIKDDIEGAREVRGGIGGLSDASATLGIIQRQGLGKLRHVDCSFLFVQALNAERVIAL